MKRNSVTWAVFSANTRKPRIDPKPPYQRGPVWSRNQQQLFIDSILRDFDIPKLYLRIITDPDSKYQWEIVDGQQRLRAVWEFLNGDYPVSEDSDPIGKHRVAGSFFKDLHDDIKDQLQGYELNIVTLEESEDREIEEMFIRLQNGIPLNSAEKRNAISGNIRDFVHEIASSHRLISKSIAFPDRRYSHDEVVAQMLLIETRGGPATVRHSQLKEMYTHGRQFNPRSGYANKFKRVINFLARAFPQKSPELTKVNLLSLYTVASESITKYAIADRAEEFGHWFIGFEHRRREDEKRPEDERAEEMVSYQLAVLQQTANLASQQERRRILIRDLLSKMPDLILLDDQRQFTIERNYSGL